MSKNNVNKDDRTNDIKFKSIVTLGNEDSYFNCC